MLVALKAPELFVFDKLIQFKVSLWYKISRNKIYSRCFILLFRFILFDLVTLSNSD